MKSINTCHLERYSPLIPAMKVFCEAEKGERIEISMDNAQAFSDLKEFLSEEGIGFREIYNGEQMTLEFTK